MKARGEQMDKVIPAPFSKSWRSTKKKKILKFIGNDHFIIERHESVEGNCYNSMSYTKVENQ